MADLREALSAALAEAPQLEQPESLVVEPNTQLDAPEAEDTRARDESGRFAKVEGTVAVQASESTVAPTSDTGAKPGAAQEIVPEAPQITRPSTWKKEYWPLYDKLALGQPLNPDEAKKLADYTNQRETEFKTGVSTYKAEADKSKELQEAIAPFLPELQIYGIKPGQWIANLGRAHYTLAKGSPQEKLAMFHKLANEYGVDIGQQAAPAPNVDPQVAWLSQELNQIKGAWSSFQSEQQKQAQASMMSDIHKFASGHQHFESVREQMSGLLQAGMAQDLEDAYTKAIRMSGLQEAAPAVQPANSSAQAAAVVAKAKANAVSPRSTSPSTPDGAKPKGLRSTLAEQLDAAMGGGRV